MEIIPAVIPLNFDDLYSHAETINEDCTGCTNCATVCPDGVITVYRVKSKVV